MRVERSCGLQLKNLPVPRISVLGTVRLTPCVQLEGGQVPSLPCAAFGLPLSLSHMHSHTRLSFSSSMPPANTFQLDQPIGGVRPSPAASQRGGARINRRVKWGERRGDGQRGLGRTVVEGGRLTRSKEQAEEGATHRYQ